MVCYFLHARFIICISWYVYNVFVAALMIEKPTLSTIWSTKGLPGGLFVAAEVLFIMRPLIYVLFIRKYGLRSWIPWLISLIVDLTGYGFLSHVTNLGHSIRKSSIALTTSEKDEVIALSFHLYISCTLWLKFSCLDGLSGSCHVF